MKYPPYPRYKPSGVEWLGETPEHWEVEPLKYALSEVVSGGTPEISNESYWEYGDDPGLNWVAIVDMTRAFRIFSTERKITPAGQASKGLRIMPPGTLLYSMYASLGKVAVLEVPAAFNQAILALLPREGRLLPKYLRFWLANCEPHLELFASSNTQDNLNAAKVRQMALFTPPIDEQRAIATFLEIQTSKLDTLIAKKRELNERLAEKRTVLISQTVTRGLPPTPPARLGSILAPSSSPPASNGSAIYQCIGRCVSSLVRWPSQKGRLTLRSSPSSQCF
jgi:type I restriction enzyme S subunit